MFPKSEYRRVYMKKLIKDIECILRVSPRQAKEIATQLCLVFRHKVFNGEDIDLGFMNIFLKTLPPREIRFNLNGQNKGRFFKGESARWNCRVHKSWIGRKRPRWA